MRQHTAPEAWHLPRDRVEKQRTGCQTVREKYNSRRAGVGTLIGGQGSEGQVSGMCG